MKLLLVASALATAIYVQAQSEPLSQCVLNCMTQAAETVDDCEANYNQTSCLCTEGFAQKTRYCFYTNTCYQDIIPFYNFREAACGTLADDIDHEGFIPSNGNSTYDKANGTSSAALSGGASASAAATTSAPATADAVSSSAAAFATVNMVTARGLALGGMSVTGILIGGLLLI
ncbi:hypothetical protein C347_00954 [Cryptococcus neoformans AD2-60a]|uniref:Extracellular membrane protein CFEM domain-containing protein n=1 Tax=Cryptococcus neoformans Tu259-1 TaxID=1230072 RepID=A0A854QLM6_CRYNE|nr:hypothetical protein C347_00954 [Cryptococcus neoformans var. grubii AD2-60a]OWZ54155.1 hypothetical protein C353_00889 [Cryptococcus neoformans var. grubii AD1-83a]OWZ57224.1 hypothetical protein C368_01390 [Cryptococcus neoformans var. grubii 125.91]OXC86774.1 hypothetical protein C344_00888 [Cryptococcus neoformans var. grubii AD1-7a]OXG28472.1 hypothetical protein C361_00876 [Cryptococcus neoformans var. grubii Tu259-1]OXG45218.1 hypothetical protein C359_00490 [Cryptococcus neoformans 